MTELHIETRDPVIARDGRPFGDAGGNRMRTLPWPLPQTVAGAVRTHLGIGSGGVFDTKTISDLKRVSVHGPLLVSDGRLFLPAPADCLLATNGDAVKMVRAKIDNGCGTDLPSGLEPVMLPAETAIEKFKTPPQWWAVDRLAQWMSTAKRPAAFFQNAADFRMAPVINERTHVAIDPQRLAASDQKLFSSQGLVLDRFVDPANQQHAGHLIAATNVDDGHSMIANVRNLAGIRPLGGERRLVRFETRATQLLQCPSAVATAMNALSQTSQLTMVLATPAIFAAGWKPGWLDQNLVGTPPGWPTEVRIKLRAVANQRWTPVSGWSYETGNEKPVRRLTPAGSVFFFDVETPAPLDPNQVWLKPVSDDEQNRRDGFGLAAWGVVSS